MKDTTITQDTLDAPTKKVYTKPVLNQVELVAEEAVLAVCKNGNPETCEAVAITCLNIAGS
jgi:hypothetical protein